MAILLYLAGAVFKVVIKNLEILFIFFFFGVYNNNKVRVSTTTV